MTSVFTRRRFVTLGTGTFAAGVLNATHLRRSAFAESAKVRIATGLRATSQSITWIGTEAGVFKKHGLDVIFPKLEVGGPEATAGLMRGDWDFVQTGTVPIAEAVLNGGDAVILLRNTDPGPNTIIKSKRAIASLNQLNGKRVGVLTDVYSGQTGVVTRLAIEKAGATATYVGLGTYEKIYAALVASEIDAGALPVDYRSVGQRKYHWNVFDTETLGVPSIFATTRRLIATNRDVVLRTVKGFVETIQLFKTQPNVVVPLLGRFLNFSDRKAVEELQKYYVPRFPAVPRPELSEGMQNIRKLFASRYPAAQSLRESDVSDPSIIDEIEKSGYIAKLYSRKSKG